MSWRVPLAPVFTEHGERFVFIKDERDSKSDVVIGVSDYLLRVQKGLAIGETFLWTAP